MIEGITQTVFYIGFMLNHLLHEDARWHHMAVQSRSIRMPQRYVCSPVRCQLRWLLVWQSKSCHQGQAELSKSQLGHAGSKATLPCNTMCHRRTSSPKIEVFDVVEHNITQQLPDL